MITLYPAATPVTGAELERRLAEAAALAPGPPAAGLFGPESRLWRVNGEAALFLGAVRALLLQLADPRVAAGVAEHSHVLSDPLGRFHRTFGTLYPMLFGTTEQALSRARRLHARHAVVAGTLPDGRPYAANAPAAMAWVQATLVETALWAHDLLLPPLSDADRDAYWQENRRLAGLFGLDPALLPEDWPGFRRAWQAVLDGPALMVTPPALQVVRALLQESPPALRPPRWMLDLTACALPARLAEGFGLETGPAPQRRADRAVRWLRRLYPHLPAGIRRVGPAREAQARLAGRRPGPGIRLSNRVWIGRPIL